MKYLKKTLSFVLALAMVFSMVIVPKNVSVVDADSTSTSEDSTNYTYFDTTMFKYDTDTFNAATKALETTTTGLENLNSIPDTEIDVVIVSNGYALKDDGNGNLVAVKFEKSNDIDESLLWILSSKTYAYDSRTIKNKNTGNYLNIDSNNVSLSSNGINLYVDNSNIYYYDWDSWNYCYLNYNTTSNKFEIVKGSASNSLTYYAYTETSVDQGIYFNRGEDTTTISGTIITNENYNKWTGKWNANNKDGIEDTDKLYACTGIVQPQLDKNGKIVFNHPEAGIFDTSKNTGKTIYNNVEMPFKTDSNGYYYYDSEEYDVKFPNNTPTSNVKLEDEGLTKIKYGENGYRTAFLPFSSSTNNIDSNPQFHFGMNMSVKFYMTEDGKITTVDEDGNEQKNDMTFEFSGDDDVWVFVDGKLVLDIGGIHDAISADINFATGVANVYQGTTDTVVRNSNIYNDIFDTDATTWRSDEDKIHTLQVFYLERGEGLSNCKIKFNLPQHDTLDVTKALGNNVNNTTDITDDTLKALLNQTFKFRISSSEDNSTYEAYANKKYTIYENGSNVGSGVTNSKGEFTLKFNQTASFLGDKTSDKVTNLGQDGYFKVEEIVGDDAKYTTKWKTSKSVKGTITEYDMKENDTSTEAVLEIDGKTVSDESSKYHFTFINTLQPTLNDDVVVLDYGKKVKIDVLANDVLFASERKIAGINTEGCLNGELTLSDNNTTLTYRPYKYMDSVDRATYTVNTSEISSDGTSATANVSIIPATTVYYEDNFGGTGKDGEDGLAITYTGNWYTVNDDGTTDSIKSNTNTDYQDDGSVGQGNQYGYDSSYEGDGKFSDGSSAVVEGTYNETTKTFDATASFNFTGTGFDIISRTDSTCGTIHVVVTDEDGYLVLQGEDGEFYVSDIKASERPRKATISVINQGTNNLYQIPVISCKGLDHGTYNVLIRVAGPSPSAGIEQSMFYLDAIRIYEPIKTTNGEDSTEGDDSNDASSVPGEEGAPAIDPEVLDAYAEDNELDTKVTKIKEIILSEDGSISNNAFIDTIKKGESGSTSDKDTYDNLGPNNEVYLSEGQGITFNINSGNQIPVKVYIGAKSPNSKESTLSVSSVDSSSKSETVIKSATDMYYDVTECVKFTKNEDGDYIATIVIGNKNTALEDNTSLLSLTNIKLAYTDKTPISTASLYSVPEDNSASVALASRLLVKKQVVETEEPTESKEVNLEITSADFTSSKASILKSATLVVKTSADVKYLGILDSKGIVIEPSSISSEVDESLVGTDKDSVAKTWTVKIKFNKLGNQKIAIYGIGEDGSASKKVKEISIKVTLLGSIKDLFTEW